MSYCRSSGDDSDVYLYGSGDGFNLHVAWKEAYERGVSRDFYVPFTYDGSAEKLVVGHLMYLRSRGIRVPDRAINRLLEEALQWEPGSEMSEQEYLRGREKLDALMLEALNKQRNP